MIRRINLSKWLIIALFFSGLGVCFFDIEVSHRFKNVYGFFVLFLSIVLMTLLEEATEKVQIFRSIKRSYIRYKSLYKQLQLVLNNIDVAVSLRDSNAEIIYFNNYYAKITMQDNKPIDDNYSDLVQHSSKLAMKAALKKQKQRSEQNFVLEGKRRLFQFTDKYLVEDGLVCTSAIDMSSKQQLARELSSNRDAQTELLESSKNAAALFGADRRLLFYNQAYCKLWEFSEMYLDSKPKYEDIIQRLFQQRKLPPEIGIVKFKQQRLNLFTQLTQTFNDFYHLPNGTTLRVIIIPHSGGGLLFSFEDLTDNYSLQASYNSLHEVYNQTINNLQECISIYAPSGALIKYNRKFTELWQLSDSFLKTNPNIMQVLEEQEKLFISNSEFELHRQKINKSFNQRLAAEIAIELPNTNGVTRKIAPLPDGSTMITDAKNVSAS